MILTGTTTLATWMERWLKLKKAKVSQSTYSFYEEAVRLHIPAEVKKVRLDRLTSQHVQHAIDLANTTRNAQRVHLVFNMALKKAVADGVIARNVADSVDKPGHAKTEQDSLEPAEAKRVIRAAIKQQEDRDYDGPLMATRWAAAFWTGARPAEVRGVELDRLDLDAGLVDLSWQLKQLKKTHGCGDPVDGKYPCGKVRVSFCPGAHWDLPPDTEYRECRGALLWTRPKTAAGKRIVPIIPPLVEMLRVHLRETADWPNPHNLIWRNRDGRPIGEKQEWRLWTELLAAAKLPRVDQYATRHTTATLLDELKVPQDVRMQIMGHSSKVAARMYVHVDQTRTRAALSQLGELLSLD